MKKNKVISISIWLLIAGFFIFLTLNRHSRTGVYNYHSEIWADKAGYNVYLPLTFIYHFNTSLFPDSIEGKTGDGFSIDRANNIVKTKYTYGVSLMQAPFFIVSHWLAKPLGYPDSGYSMPFYRAIDIAAVFYFIMGLIFLWLFLKKRISKTLSFFTLLFLIAATNLYYYAIDETGMSHIYSFAIFCAILWLVDFFDIKKTIHVLSLSILFAMVIIIRPVNVVFIVFLLLLEKEKVKTCIADLNQVKIFKTLLSLLPAVIIILIQLLYWKYSSGNYFTNSYKGESFIFLTHPQLFKVWFSTNNGLFTYTPMWLFLIAGVFAMIITKKSVGWIYLLCFLVLTYIIASWWSWWMGCGFGHRAFVEYLPVFIIPGLYLWKKASAYKVLQVFFVIIFLVFAIYNMLLTYCWDGCYYGGIWDWNFLWQKFLEAF